MSIKSQYELIRINILRHFECFVRMLHIYTMYFLIYFFSQGTPVSSSGQMTGIAALAAAAAATPRITTAASPSMNTLSTHHSGIKVVTPTIMTPSGIKVTPVGNKIGECSLCGFC